MNGAIYEITNLVNGKRYFGQTIQKCPATRWSKHKSDATTGKLHPLYISMRKYGICNFQFRVIIDGIQNQTELNRLEEVWIDTCKTADRTNGYNIERFANGSGPKSKETRLKMSLAKKGVPKSPEHCKRNSDSHRGIELSDATKLKMSAAKKGIAKTDEHKNNIAKAMSGRRLADTHKQRISESQMGKPHPRKQS